MIVSKATQASFEEIRVHFRTHGGDASKKRTKNRPSLLRPNVQWRSNKQSTNLLHYAEQTFCVDTNLSKLVLILFQSDASDEVLCVTTAGFGGDVGQKRLTDEENCVEVSINHVHNRLY